MTKIVRPDGNGWVEFNPKPAGEKQKRRTKRSDDDTIVGILNYLKLAESDRIRYRDVLDEFMRTQDAATMKEVAARRMNCPVPKTKADAKRLLVNAYNISALKV